MGYVVALMFCFATPNPAIGDKIQCNVFSKPVEATSVMECEAHAPQAQRDLLAAYGGNTFIKEMRCLPLGEPA